MFGILATIVLSSKRMNKMLRTHHLSPRLYDLIGKTTGQCYYTRPIQFIIKYKEMKNGHDKIDMSVEIYSFVLVIFPKIVDGVLMLYFSTKIIVFKIHNHHNNGK